MNTIELIDEVVSLPVEERTILVETLLKSLNQPESDIDKKWVQTAKKRLQELRDGEVKAINGKDVFGRIWQRLEK